MKDLVEVDTIIGMKIIHTSDSICLSQFHYTQMVFNKFRYSDYSFVSTLYDPSIHLLKNIEKFINQEKYTQIIGSLIYLSNRIKSDIAYTISRLSRYTSYPSIVHWTALERVFQYLKGSIDYFLHLVGYPNLLESYSDSN